jgi:hypothetical protein
MAGRGGHHQHVHVVPQRVAAPARGLQGVGTRKACTALMPRARPMTAATVGSIWPGCCSSSVAHHGIAFGHPGAFVQQRGHGMQRPKVQRHRASAPRPAGGPAPAARRGIAAVAVKCGAVGHAHAQARRPGKGPGWKASRRRPRRALRARQHGGGVGHREREHRHAVQAAAGRQHAAGADSPRRGLQPDDVVEARRHAARARGVGAQRERHRPAPPARPSRSCCRR